MAERHSPNKKSRLPGHDIIVVGTSAGGVEALRDIIRELPVRFPAALFLVMHVPGSALSLLPEILRATGALPVAHAIDGERIEHGRVYVAPPDYHLLLESRRVRVLRGPRENGHRPAADPLFRSAALSHGPRVVGVVLTGNLDDGTAGLHAVKSRGGVAVVQDPKEAIFPGMPASAQQNVAVDYCVPLSAMAPLLVKLAQTPAENSFKQPASKSLRLETKSAENGSTDQIAEELGRASVFACPDCNGSLFEIEEGQLVHFRCRTGHAFGGESLLSAKTDEFEESLWAALRSLEEQAELAQRLAARAREKNQKISASRFSERAAYATRHAEALRRILRNAGKQSRFDSKTQAQSK